MQNRRHPMRTIFLMAVAVSIGGWTAYRQFFSNPEAGWERQRPPVPAVAEKHPDTPERQVRSQVFLYFCSRDGDFLMSEERTVTHSDDPVGLGRQIVKAIIEGPREGLVRTIPQESGLNAFFIADGGVAYADFNEALRENHPGGVQTEIMSIYSIVNSLVLNVPEIKQVKILIGGREAATLAGHIDLRLPYRADMKLVR